MKTPTYTQTHRPIQRDTHTANQATTNKDTSKNKKQVQQNPPKKEKNNKNPHRAGRATQARPNFKGTPCTAT